MRSHRTSFFPCKEGRFRAFRHLPAALVLSATAFLSYIPDHSRILMTMDHHAGHELKHGEGADRLYPGDLATGIGIIRVLGSHLRTPHDVLAVGPEATDDPVGRMERQRSIVARTPSRCPADGQLTSGFGWRDSPFTGGREFHKGIDIASSGDSSVYAAADGVVASCRRFGTFGNVIDIDHGCGLVTRYGHLSESTVRLGSSVRKGDRIAHAGDSGRSTGSHLHYEIMIHGVNVNPQRYMLK